MPKLPAIETLHAALAAARLGSFSAAALDLGVTHAAISRRVAAAEEWAGVRLFERHGRGVRPTDHGQRILSRTALALDEIAALPRAARVRRRLSVVRVAATPAFARFWLMPRLRALECEPADVRIDVIADLKHANLVGGEVDLAIRYGRGGWRSGPEARLFDDVLVPVIARTQASRLHAVHASDVVQWPLLHSGDAAHWRAWMDAHGLQAAAKAEDRVFIDYGLTMDAAASGLGVALWNPALHPLDERLCALEQFGTASPFGYFLLRRDGDTNSPAATVAARILAACRAAAPA